MAASKWSTRASPPKPSRRWRWSTRWSTRKTRAEAEAYLKYLWSDEGQTIAANNYLRPRNPEVLAKFSDRFPKVDFFSVVKTFGDWRTVQKTHFADGGVFDQIYTPN